MSFIQKCGIDGEEFIVRDEDLDFYKAISPTFAGNLYLIPPPKLCPKHRERRRLCYRNERKLFRRKSSLSGNPLISFFRPDAPWKVYSHAEWWSDSWDPLQFGIDFDFNKGFFEQFYDLQLNVPRPPLVNNKSDNSDYCNFSDNNKSCYLITSANDNVDCFYSFWMLKCTDSADCSYCDGCELCYECVNCNQCYNLNFSQNCVSCSDSSYLFNCKGIDHCFLSVNLANKEQYRILNQPYEKEEYTRKIAEIQGDPQKLSTMLQEFEQLKVASPTRAATIISSENAIGDNIYNSKNIFQGFDIHEGENCSYVHDVIYSSNSFDICFAAGEWSYESTSLMGYGHRFTNFCRSSFDLFYCDNCHSCKNCFGCIGLRNKEYCIFNKQYSKEEYEKMCARIIAHMNERGEFGEFFPEKYSLFPYADTLATDYFPKV